MDGHLRRYHADADAAAGDGAQRRRSQPCQCHGGAGQARSCASAGRSGCRRYHPGGHRAGAGSRLHQAAGLCRAVAAGIDSRRRHPAELRRHHRPEHTRQHHPQPAGRPDAVIGQRRIGSSRGHRGAADFRRRRLAQKPGRQVPHAGGCAAHRVGGGRSRTSGAGPGRTGAVLSGARDVCGGQEHSRSRHRRRQRRCAGSHRAGGAFGREHADGPSRLGPPGPRQSRGRQQLRFAIVEGAGLCAPAQVGGSAGEIQERRIRHHLAADRDAAHRDRGCDACVARGQGLFRRRQAQQRPRSDRPVRPK